MVQKKSIWSAVFLSQTIIKECFPYRKLSFKNLKKNEDNVIVKNTFCINESDSIKAGGRFQVGDIVSFYADDNLENIEFCYPYYGYQEKYSELQERYLKIIKEREKK